jgi:hypothetical protein
MGSSYWSTLDTGILFLRVWGRTVTKNGNNSDIFFNSSL